MSTRRISLALAACATAAAATAVVTSSGSAQSSPTTLHFVGQSQKNVGFFPRHRPRQGDRFGFGDTITGDDTGIDRGVCTIVGQQALCTVFVKLSKGTLSVQGFSTQRNKNTPLAVTGGTGAYNGARGTAFATDVSSTKTDITVQLLP